MSWTIDHLEQWIRSTYPKEIRDVEGIVKATEHKVTITAWGIQIEVWLEEDLKTGSHVSLYANSLGYIDRRIEGLLGMVKLARDIQIDLKEEWERQNGRS